MMENMIQANLADFILEDIQGNGTLDQFRSEFLNSDEHQRLDM
jgi:hypothetical protein